MLANIQFLKSITDINPIDNNNFVNIKEVQICKPQVEILFMKHKKAKKKNNKSKAYGLELNWMIKIALFK